MPQSEVRLLTEADFPALVEIMARAYPSETDSPAERQRMLERWITRSADPTEHLYGAFDDGLLLGGMRLYDFTMTFGQESSPNEENGTSSKAVQLPVGGVGMVGVDLMHKKEHVARDLIAFFLKHYRDQDAPLALLYPFRPDFYKQMGFGYGTKMNEYRIRTASLPTGGGKAHLVSLAERDSDLLLDYYNRYQRRTHGMLRRTAFEIARKFASVQNHLVGYLEDGVLQGYFQFRFKSAAEENFLLHDIEVIECLYDTPTVLSEFLTFLQTQADQIRTIVFLTQDEDFHYLLPDPRNGSDHLIPQIYHEINARGVGLMYRVLDVAQLFRRLANGGYSFDGQTCRLQVQLTDTFFPENSGISAIWFENGEIQSVEQRRPGDVQMSNLEKEITIQLDVSDFSSLILGAVGFKTLYRYGLAQLSDPHELDRVHRLFCTASSPRCVTAF
ncbi:MAG: enhanced intracellular survival protein Eis [Ktedonobacterales bacterium]